MVARSTSPDTFVVISIGSRFLRVGLSNDVEPIVCPYPGRIPEWGVDSHGVEVYDNVGLTIEQKLQLNDNITHNDRNYKKMNELVQSQRYEVIRLDLPGGLTNYDQSVIYQLLYDNVSTKLMINPMNHKVLVVDTLISDINRLQISRTLLSKLQFKSVLFVPEPEMCVISSGQRHGLVVDFGWNSVRIAPVYDLTPVLKLGYEEVKAINGKSLHLKMVQYLSGLDNPKVDELLHGSDSFDFIQDIIIRYCYVRCLDEVDIVTDQFEIADGVFIPNSFRYEIIEQLCINDIMFEQISNVIGRLDIHIRKEVIGNVIFTGGLSNIPGFKWRMLQEIRKKFEPYNVVSKSCLGPWTGASIYSNLIPGKNNLEITRHDIKSMTSSTGYKLSAFSNHINRIHTS